jgi:GNAT superfamily N-acetyltransferase
MPQLTIDQATEEDLPALCDLLTVLFTQEAEFHPDPARQRDGLALILNDPAKGRLLVARDAGGTAVGMANLLYSVSTFLGGKVAVLEDVVVHPDFRGRGIGTQLLQGALELAEAEGCRRVTLLTDAANVTAQAFYERHGFAKSTMIPMRRALPT